MDFLLINDKAIKGLINFVKVCQVLVPVLVGTQPTVTPKNEKNDDIPQDQISQFI